MDKYGSLEVICGPMFAGKTEELIRRTRRLDFAKKKYLIFKPSIDNRYMTDCVVSHNKSSMSAVNIDINRPLDMNKFITDDLDAVIIDEVQFFNEDVITLIKDLVKKGFRVICAGLDLDFKAEPFGVMPYILAMAEHVTKLSAICVKCGHDATRTQRLIDGKTARYDDPVVLVGAVESYEARCVHCHEVRK